MAGNRRFPRTAVLLAIGASLTFALPAAQAAPPDNDAITAAVTVPADQLPWTYEQDTREATRSRTDGECVRSSSVWFRYRPATTRVLRLVTLGSDYDTVLALFQGRRDQRTLVGCSDDRFKDYASGIRYRFEAGRRYWIAVSSYYLGAARDARLTLYAPSQLEYQIDVTSAEAGEVSGRAIVSGVVTCNEPALASVSMVVRQRVVDHVARGRDDVVAACDADGEPFTLRIDSRTDWAFLPGQALLTHTSWATAGWNDTVVIDEQEGVIDLTSAAAARR